ncbi:MAG: SprT-like domain-containing protein [Anaerolineales bacterium]
MTSHSIRNILTFVDKIQSQIDLSAVQQASRSPASWQSLQDLLVEQITAGLTDITTALQMRSLNAGDLAIRSRRAYQWLHFLSDSNSLAAHLDALQRVNLFLSKTTANQIKNGKLRLNFYHQGPLYKIRNQGKDLEMSIQEGYISAPDRIILAFLKLSVQPDVKAYRQEIKEYTFSRTYRQIRERLEYLGVPRGSFAAGSIHDLRDSFERVNQAYFDGELDQPNLIWNNRLTRRKFGHYQWDTDTVMLSSSLDHTRVPELVVDYVMYHELLHKKLGARRVKQNRIAHTGEFREAEKKFHSLQQAKRILNRIARTKVGNR